MEQIDLRQIQHNLLAACANGNAHEVQTILGTDGVNVNYQTI